MNGIDLKKLKSFSSMEFHLENPLPSDSTDLSPLFLHESDHMPSRGCIDVAVRREIIAIISEMCSGYDQLVPYLSVNYLDRFLSSQKFPKKPWTLSLIATSCVSLAAKMQGVSIPLSDLQVNGGLVFDSETVQRAEVLILGALKWRMRSITPFSFIPIFISLFQIQELALRHALIARTTEIILTAQTDINLLSFKPSIAAASALLCASNDLLPLQFPSFWVEISDCSHVNKDHLEQCYDKMLQAAYVGRHEGVHGSASTSGTASNVLDQPFGSASSGSQKTDGSGTSGRSLKRRKTSYSDQ
ncbi:hypothetical protein SAY87_011650 [Trapa incisa]|uniref:Uncharacterized protein n=1 Tax=Trapa incisa TaxID=236973 RepID=A0AAN7GR41_9MYRT|nr:hypothetical protein SAY87_011650 [Trapa incisa]